MSRAKQQRSKKVHSLLGDKEYYRAFGYYSLALLGRTPTGLTFQVSQGLTHKFHKRFVLIESILQTTLDKLIEE